MSSLQIKNLEKAIKSTMIEIAYHNYETPDKVDHDIDTAFFTIGNCFPKFDSIGDTVTRRCAKSEIYSVIEHAKSQNIVGGHFLKFAEEHITGEEVIEDILEMQED